MPKSSTIKSGFRLRDYTKNWDLYLILILPVAYILIFKYIPMYGAQIAFRKYTVTGGITGSPWVGLQNFKKFVETYNFWSIFTNTIQLSVYSLVAGFPIPILLALSLNYCTNKHYKKFAQMVTYAPHFISVVVLCGMILQFFAPRYGIVNNIIDLFGGEQKNFMGDPRFFKHIYVWSGIWQNAGWGSIIYLAVLSSIDPSLHEAAIVDGASKLQRIWHIDIAGLIPTAVTLLILNTGRLLQVGYEKVLLLQNPLNVKASEVIQTYVYKTGILSQVPNFSYSSAIGLFTSIINFILLITVNRIAKKLGETSLW